MSKRDLDGKKFRASLSISQKCDSQDTDSDKTEDEETERFTLDESNSESESVIPPSQDPPFGQDDDLRCSSRSRSIFCSRNAQVEPDDIIEAEKLTVKSKKPTEWSINDVQKWATNHFNEEIAKKFQKEEVDGSTLLGLKDNHLLDMLGLTTIGKKAKFAHEVGKLKGEGAPLQVVNKQNSIQEVGDYANMDRVLTNSEKDQLKSSDRSLYNTKKKKILQKVKKRWPESEPTPWFRNNSKSTTELQDFVELLSSDKECVYPAAALKRNAIEELVRRHMAERRRKQKDLELTSSDSNSSSPEPSTSKVHGKNVVYESYFNKDLTAMSAQAIVLKWMGKETVCDLKMDCLRKEAKILGLYLLRNKDKMTHVNAIAATLLKKGMVAIADHVPLSKVAINDISVVQE